MLTLTWGTDILFHELRSETGGDVFEKHPLHYDSLLGCGFNAKLVFFFNVFSGDAKFDALMIEL